MSTRIHYTNCPVCNSSTIQLTLQVKDFIVSKEFFHVFSCKDCQVRFTQDIPGPGYISAYYKSEDYISHTNTSKGLINRLYQLVRNRTLKQKRRLVEKATGLPAGKILDIGCGIGSFLHEMKGYGWEITGLEPDEGARKMAKQLYALEPYAIENIYELTSGSYDAISLWHVLEHVHDLHGYLKKINELLTKNGKLFIAVPNYTSRDAEIYKEYWAAYDVPRHLYHFSPFAMKKLIEKHDLTIEKLKPMWFDSFYVAMLSSKYQNTSQKAGYPQGKINYFTAVWNGLISNLNAIGKPEKCSSVIYIIGKKNIAG